MRRMNEPRKVISGREAAARLGLTERRLRGWRAEGRGPRWLTDPVSGMFLGYEVAALDEWLEAARAGER